MRGGAFPAKIYYDIYKAIKTFKKAGSVLADGGPRRDDNVFHAVFLTHQVWARTASMTPVTSKSPVRMEKRTDCTGGSMAQNDPNITALFIQLSDLPTFQSRTFCSHLHNVETNGGSFLCQ